MLLILLRVYGAIKKKGLPFFNTVLLLSFRMKKTGKFKVRSPGHTAVPISLTEDDLRAIDARAKRLGLNRSAYFRFLAKLDLEGAVNLPAH